MDLHFFPSHTNIINCWYLSSKLKGVYMKHLSRLPALLDWIHDGLFHIGHGVMGLMPIHQPHQLGEFSRCELGPFEKNYLLG